MAFVKELKIEDNAAPALAASKIVAQRLGKSLRERYQDFIHKRECKAGQADYDVKMASRAIAAFSIYNLAGVDDATAGKSVCDSAEDGGIDALCVNHSEKTVVIVQSKFNQAGNGTWTKDDFLNRLKDQRIARAWVGCNCWTNVPARLSNHRTCSLIRC